MHSYLAVAYHTFRGDRPHGSRRDRPHGGCRRASLLITNAPNSYLINRYTNVARHVVDPGPTYNVVIPVFPSERDGKLQGLQMGRELAFFRADGSVSVSKNAQTTRAK